MKIVNFIVWRPQRPSPRLASCCGTSDWAGPASRPLLVAAIASRTSTWLQGLASQKACMARRVSRRGMAEDGTKRRRRGECGRPGGTQFRARGARDARGRGRTDERAETRAQSMRGETDATSASERARACLAAALALGGVPPLRRRFGNRVPARCHRASGKFFRTKKLMARQSIITRVGHPSPTTLSRTPLVTMAKVDVSRIHITPNPAPLGAELNLEVRRRRPPSLSASGRRLSPASNSSSSLR